MGTYNKRTGEMNTGGNNKNRTGGQKKSGRGHGQDHVKDQIHRLHTQKNGGKKTGGRK
jgi:hypothetical protein